MARSDLVAAFRAIAGGLVCLGLASATLAQSGRPGGRRNQPPSTQPATPTQPTTPGSTPPGATTPAAPGATDEDPPKVGPYVVPGREREWTLTARVNVRAYQDPGVVRQPGSNQPDQMPTIDRWEFDTLTVVWPLVPSTASSSLGLTAEPGLAPELKNFKFTVDDHDATRLSEFRTEVVTAQASGKPYHSGVWLAMFKLNRAIRAREVEFEVVVPSRSWETEFDEARARTVAWPTGAWPEEAASTLQPMMFVDFAPTNNAPLNNTPVRNALARWNNNQDPRTVPPVTYAKWIAGQIAEAVQISGKGLAANRNGLLEGVLLQSPSETLTSGTGNEFDICVLLTTAYRMSGLPARLVVGYDVQADSRNEPGFLEPSSGGSGDLRCWVEFCLFDEAHNTINWVPVDIVRIRKLSSRLPRDFMEPGKLRYFGTHDELDEVVPFAFQFFPPTTVRSYGSPGFWGWFVTPEAPNRAWQAISIRAATTPRRGGR